MKGYFVYILTNKSIEGFTKKYNLTKLVYFEEFTNPADAISAEKKIELIESFNSEWKDLGLVF